ncbi:MAG: XkdF-like putative serine protease domain-containing protein [Chitinophagaceae bacterium]
MNKSLPTYELRIDPEKDNVVNAIALVDEPAIESNFIAFSKDQNVEFKFASNEERMELIGPALIPDMKIFRKDEDGEYNVFFSKNTIRQIAQTYFQKGFQNNLNIQHTAVPAKSFVFQAYIVDGEMGMSAPKGIDVPEGSWIVGVKVTDKEVWKDIKAGKVKGFSIEGLFQMFSKIDKELDAETKEAMHILKEITDYLSNKELLT